MSDTVDAKIAAWGNGAGLRLSRAVLEQAGLHINDPVKLSISNGRIVVRRKLSLADLLDGYDPEQHHHPVVFDAPLGREFGADE